MVQMHSKHLTVPDNKNNKEFMRQTSFLLHEPVEQVIRDTNISVSAGMSINDGIDTL